MPSRRSSAIGVGLGVLVVVAASALAYLVGRREQPAAVPASAASSRVGPRTLANEPPPASTEHREALAAYRRARLLQRDCEWTRALEELRRAVELDPDFGEAQLQLAIARFHLSFLVDEEVRAAYRAAVEARRRMDARDRELLEVVEPLFARDPPEWPATLARAADLAARRPDDAELQLRVATLRTTAGDLDVGPEVVAACRLDPEYADAWALRITVEAVADRADGARDAIETCHRLAPTSAECSVGAVQALAHFGQCEDAEREARRLAGTPMAWVHAPLLLHLGHSPAAVERAFEQYWTSPALPHPRPVVELADRWTLAMHGGDFATARSLAERYVSTAMSLPKVGFEGFRWSALVSLAVAAAEAGELDLVAPALREALVTHREWRADAPHNGDQSLFVWSWLARAGLATEAEVRAAREAYRARFGALFETHRTLAWAAVECAGVTSAADAERAIAARPGELRPSELFTDDVAPAWIGIALSRASRHEEALPWLRRAASSCYASSWPQPVAEARLALGDALLATGDTKGACAAWTAVTTAWARAKPRSASADAASRRAEAARCGAAAVTE